MYCGEIIQKYELAPGTVSHHLRILTEAGLIECRREGQFVHNRVLPETMREYTQTLSKLARSGKLEKDRAARLCSTIRRSTSPPRPCKITQSRVNTTSASH